MAAKKLTKKEKISKAWKVVEYIPEMFDGIDETKEEHVRMYAEDLRRSGQAALDILDGKKK